MFTQRYLWTNIRALLFRRGDKNGKRERGMYLAKEVKKSKDEKGNTGLEMFFMGTRRPFFKVSAAAAAMQQKHNTPQATGVKKKSREKQQQLTPSSFKRVSPPAGVFFSSFYMDFVPLTIAQRKKK